MKKEYDLSKMKTRQRKQKQVSESLRTAISIKLDSETLGEIKVEAMRLGMPYQTLINSILYRFATGELVDRKNIAKP